jgi:ELWxxDGT repeat protein
MKTHPPISWIAGACLVLTTSLGLSQGVQLLKDINTSALAPSTLPDEMLAVGSRIYIATDNPIVGSELWSFDIGATFNNPNSVTADSAGNFYVADTANHIIRKISSTGLVTTLAGSPGVSGSVDGIGTGARFNSPRGLGIDNNGNVYVADTGNHTIRRINSAGAVVTVAGTAGSTGGNNGTGSAARFNGPEALAVHGPSGDIYVADTGNHTVRQVTPAGVVSTTAGTAGSQGDTNATGAAARFRFPRGIAVDGVRNLYIADSGNHLIRKLDNVLVVTTLAGTSGVSGSADGTGTAASFSSPEGVALGAGSLAGNILVGDTGNHTVRRITSAGLVSVLAGTVGQSGVTNGTGTAAKFFSPQGLVVDGTANVYVADTSNHLIRKITGAGVVTNQAGSPGVSGSGDGGANTVTSTTGPSLVKDIFPGSGDSEPKYLTAAGSSIYFSAIAANGQRDVWKSDGTNAGTVRVGNSLFFSGEGPERLIFANGLLYYQGFDLDNGRELWKSDGTTAGTGLLKDINITPGQDGSILRPFAFGTSLLFVADDANATTPTGSELWKSGGTTATTNILSDLLPGAGSSNPDNFTIFNGFVYFSADGTLTGVPDVEKEPVGNELFRTSATGTNGHVLVEDIVPGASGSSPSNFVVSGGTPATGGRMFFVASTDIEGRELWITNGGTAPSDTSLVKDIVSGSESNGSAAIAHLTPIAMLVGTVPNQTVSNRIVFTADDGSNGNELWISDGTSIGTVMLKDITSGPNGSILENFIRVSAQGVVFTVKDATDKLTLWKTDGTNTGTVQIEDFITESNPSLAAADAVNLRSYVLVGSTLYFMLGDDEIWRTDGISDSGTVLVHRFRGSTGGSFAQNFTRLGDGRVVFAATGPTSGQEVWITDGTETGTTLLAELNSGSNGSSPQDFTIGSGNNFFFSAIAAGADREVYASDGSTVSLLKEINTGGSADPQNLFWNQNTLYFSARDSGSNSELWKSDGTEAGTVLVKDLNEANSSANGSFPSDFAAIDSTVFFAATTLGGRELFKTDGTDAGTVRVKDIAVGGNSSNPEEMVIMPTTGPLRRVYFVAAGSGSGQNTGRELWKSDGTTTGTVVVKDIVPDGSSIEDGNPAYLTVVGNTLFFVANNGTHGKELWKSDGTAAGTVLVKNINTISAGAGSTQGSDPTDLINVNGMLFFLADDGVNGRELWVSNGTSAGTVIIKPGLGDAGITNMAAVNDVLCFSADNGVVGRETWMSDGTTLGTVIVSDLVPGSGSSNPASLFGVDGNLLFAAADTTVGDEPRLASLASTIVVEQPAATALIPGVSVVDFTPTTPVPFGQNTSLTFVIKNAGINTLRNISALLSGPNAADFSIFTKPATSIAGASSSNLVVRFTPKEGGERIATLTILSSDTNTRSFVIQLTADCSKDPTISLHPVSRLVKLGAPVTMTSAATGSNPLSLQWRRNAAPIVDALSGTLYLYAAQIKDAGIYSLQAKNNAKPGGLAFSNTAELGVVEDYMPARIVRVASGNKATTLTVNAAGNGLTYLWKRSANADLSSPESLSAPFTNITTKTLSFTKATPGVGASDSKYYFCEVTGPGGTVIGGTTELRVFSAPPVVTPAQTLPVGVVGAPYFYQVLVDATVARTPHTYKASPLPSGLKIDAKTGIISGVPTKVETKNVFLEASNGILPAPDKVPATLTVINLPSGLDGLFHGLVERDQEINGMAGGRVEITVTKTGSYSGKFTLGAISYSFKGNLSFSIDSDPDNNPLTNDAVAEAPFTGMVRIPRPGIAAPLDFSFTIDETTKNTLSAGQLTSVNVSGPVNADVSGWKVTTNTARYLGLHNFGIRLPALVNSVANPNIGDDDVPQGDGYGSFTVSTKGVLSIAGMTADGEKITCGTHVGPSGEVLLYQSLYTTARKGSICGLLNLSTGAVLDSPNDNVITSSAPFDWTRPPATAVLGTATNTRTYRAGFGLADTPAVTTPVELEAFGGYYQPEVHLLQIGTGSTTLDNASLAFTEAGVNLPTREPDLPSLAVNLSAVKVLTPSTALTKITAVVKTGIFNGSFALADDDITTTTPAALNNKADELKRTVNYLGLIVPEAGNHRGVGYFMIPQIPPVATAAKTAQILSGKVSFDND